MSGDIHDPAPLNKEGVASAPTWRAAYSDRTAALMATFSQLAYMPFEVDGERRADGDSRKARRGGKAELEARLKAGGFDLKLVFNNHDTQGFLAVRPDQFAVLAFRGTTSGTDWLTNINALREPLRGRPEIEVHRGFQRAFNYCREEIIAAVNREVPNDLGLYIAGHSLGGALAQIASAVLERDNLAACYTYGSPRVGAEAFDREVKCPHYRLVNNWDIVPGVPLPWYLGYRHTGDPRLLKPNSRDRALRQDRSWFARILVDLVLLPVALIVRRYWVIDDHMIWNYRSQLDHIADARSKVATAVENVVDKVKDTLKPDH